MSDDPCVSISPQRLGGPTAAEAAETAAPSLRLTDPNRVPVFRELPKQRPLSATSMDALRDVELTVKIELGRARMRIEEVLRLEEGAVVELDRRADDPVDVYVNDRLVARGEVVVLDGKFAVRLTEVVSPIKDD